VKEGKSQTAAVSLSFLELRDVRDASVSTGTQSIVFGGTPRHEPLLTGDRHDPYTDHMVSADRFRTLTRPLLTIWAVLTLVGCAQNERYVASPHTPPVCDPALVGAWSRDTFPPDPYEYIPGVANTLTLHANGTGSDWWRQAIQGPNFSIMFEETTRTLQWHTEDGRLNMLYDDIDTQHALPYRLEGRLLIIQYANSTGEFSLL